MKYYVRESEKTKALGPFTKSEIHALLDGGMIHHHWKLFRTSSPLDEEPNDDSNWDYVSTISRDGYFNSKLSIFTACFAMFIGIVSPFTGWIIGIILLPIIGWALFFTLAILSIFMFGFAMIIEYLHNGVQVLHRIELSHRNLLP